MQNTYGLRGRENRFSEGGLSGRLRYAPLQEPEPSKFQNVWLSCLAAVGFLTWLVLQNIFAPIYIAKVGHQGEATAGLLLGASGLGSFFIGLLLPRLSDRVGRKPVLFLMGGL